MTARKSRLAPFQRVFETDEKVWLKKVLKLEKLGYECTYPKQKEHVQSTRKVLEKDSKTGKYIARYYTTDSFVYHTIMKLKEVAGEAI